ncbi:MAG: DUF4097 family beta strand repeat protein [Pseudonocardiaceae bacterium]|nr:DUF4097 family beta strand repeat protein [Pseudonocardiaceae bacterium]
METEQGAAIVRQQDFECGEPVDVVIEGGAGRLDVQLVEPPAATGTVTVRVRPEQVASSPLGAGLAGLLSWLGEQTGSAAPGELAAEAARQTNIEFEGRRLTVQTPKDMPLRAVPLSVTVTAPAGSTLTARSGSADLTVDGVAARLDAATGSGDVRVQRCEGPAEVRTGSGQVRLGSVVGTLRARTGSGRVDVISLEGSGTVQTGSGDVRVGAVSDDLSARTGSGDLTVGDAAAGWLELTTGSGQLRVGIRSGVLAEVDISSGSGEARSELPVGGPPGQDEPESGQPRSAALRVRGRTGSGDALVTAATA